uniref:Variable large protein n=1 Tax=Rhabditophanes sp. KR3021 TaxID=114890 RepID=A0AC35TVH2_9BILA
MKTSKSTKIGSGTILAESKSNNDAGKSPVGLSTATQLKGTADTVAKLFESSSFTNFTQIVEKTQSLRDVIFVGGHQLQELVNVI